MAKLNDEIHRLKQQLIDATSKRQVELLQREAVVKEECDAKAAELEGRLRDSDADVKLLKAKLAQSRANEAAAVEAGRHARDEEVRNLQAEVSRLQMEISSRAAEVNTC